MKPAIELKQIEKIFTNNGPATMALNGVSLAINKGEMVAIMGPSGSGKSTLMNMIGLLDRPTSGEVILDGETLDLTMSDSKLAKLRGKKIGFVFQTFNLLARITALANVMLPGLYQKESKSIIKNRAEALLVKVGLEKRVTHKPSQLSGGERQRVAVARALINDPEIILADEPTGNLDSKTGQEILDLLTSLHKDGKTVVIITHDTHVSKACSRIIRLKDGQLAKEMD